MSFPAKVCVIYTLGFMSSDGISFIQVGVSLGNCADLDRSPPLGYVVWYLYLFAHLWPSDHLRQSLTKASRIDGTNAARIINYHVKVVANCESETNDVNEQDQRENGMMCDVIYCNASRQLR